MNPFPIVLSSPSGGGKTTITDMLLERRRDVGYSVSCTTRRPRDGEVDGRDYYFVARDEFLARRSSGAFAESAEVHGNLYGTLRAEVERVFASKRHVIMDIDVQGAKQFAAAYPESVLIFLLPPSAETLLARLAGRGTEDRSEFLQRVRGAREELKAVGFYQYTVVNDDLEKTYNLVSSIVDTESVRHARIPQLDSQVRQLISELDRELLSLAPSA
jgi:guanylate kinase